MATVAELNAAYASITRVEPTAAQSLILADLAARSEAGIISDAQAYQYIIGRAQGTTSVAALSYQFFTGKSPTLAGFDYLVDSTTNTSDLNDAYYQGFSLENRYINFAINLGVVGEGRTNFVATFGSLSFADAVAVAYERIIGTAQAQAAGLNPTAAIADIAGRKAYFDAVVAQAGIAAADRDLAAKAAVIGYIQAEAVKANVGVYATALNNFYFDVAENGEAAADFNVDLTTVYATGSGGAGDPGTPGVSITVTATDSVSLNSANTALKSTNGNDTISGSLGTGKSIAAGGGNDTITLTTAAVAADAASIDGGQGNDTATLKVNADYTAEPLVITNVETVNLNVTGATTFDFDANDFTGLQALNIDGGAAATINNIASGVEVTVTNGTATTLTYAEAGATVNLDDASGTFVIDGAAASIGALTLNVEEGSVVTSVESNATSITVTGGELSVGTLTMDNTSGTYTFNAAGAEAVSVGAWTTGRTTTATLSAGNDFLTLTGTGNAKVYTVNAGAGNDTVDITAGGANSGSTYTSYVVDLGAGNDNLTLGLTGTNNVSVTLGAGNDRVTVDAPGVNVALNADGDIVTWAKFVDFTDGNDTIDVSAFGGTYKANTANLTGINTLEEAIDAVVTNVAFAAGGDFTTFVYKGSTYIYADVGDDGLTAGDGLIQLVGTGYTVAAAAGTGVDIITG